MRAVTIPKFGGPEVLALTNIFVPTPGAGEVTIDVAYAGVNYAEVLFRKGGVPDLPLPFVPGIEVAGTIREIGEGVDEFRVGQPVAALTIVGGGGYAEVAKAPARLVFPLDERRTSEPELAAAAASPSNVTTAYMIMADAARLQPGETVLVHAAAGGVGSAIGQMARAFGAGRVIGTVGSEDKIPYARSLGYDDVILRDSFKEQALERTDGRGVDVVVDPVGGQTRRTSLELLKPLGRLIAMGNASDAADVVQSTNELWFSSKAVLGFNLQLLSMYAPERVSRSAREALRLAGEGRIRVDVTDVLRLDDAAEAHRRIEQRSTTGKLVLKINP
ncbi:quinone oxidoreductase family protein [Cohnella zeiphila]|uniref:Zinc-binding dehydrogenase n=1 Tax=Cohnella zeiphila TaxID=2761120 RepID=A0A7X0SPK7_9BACL|nr:zinc-binding dehydrogenase [Cohnella zeiphila]MBB6733832.1 zinc-binding dehydrogenase [Cohnella zeiphila]